MDSKIQFNQICIWSSFSKNKKTFGYDGLIYLEKPFKTKGVYPYAVKAKVYHYSSDWILLNITENTCNIWEP